MKRKELHSRSVKEMKVEIVRRELQYIGERLIFLSAGVKEEMTHGDADYLFGSLTTLHKQLGETVTESLGELMDFLPKESDIPF